MPSRCFEHNSDLTELDLGFNSIREIHEAAFANLTRLSKLCV